MCQKCKEFELGGLDFRPINPGDHLSCGDIEAEAIAITHSILQPLAFFIKTPGGTIYHSGDFKIDLHAPDGSKFDMARIRVGSDPWVRPHGDGNEKTGLVCLGSVPGPAGCPRLRTAL